MHSFAKKLSSVLAAVFFLNLAVFSASAQYLTTLHSFTNFLGSSSNNPDGATPLGGLVLSGNVLYGTTSAGGMNGNGAVFAITNDGTGFTNLHEFGSITYLFANHDGARPQAGLILQNGVLFGTTELGGTNATGTIFSLNQDGTQFNDIYDFSLLAGVFNPLNQDGAQPHAALAAFRNNLYGTAPIGGNATFGTAFNVKTDGTDFVTIHDFSALSRFFPNGNSDGNQPISRLILVGSVLYGTAPMGGTNGTGTIFSVNPDGTGFVTLHSFQGIAQSSVTNREGATPLAGVTYVNGRFFGTASLGGTNGSGTVFSVNIDGSDFTTLYTFTNGTDGANPSTDLALGNNYLFGTTSNGSGTIFAIDTNDASFTTYYTFTGGNDGGSPNALIFSNNVLYGTTSTGGTNGNGTIFRIDAHPRFFWGEAPLGEGVYYLQFPDGTLFGYYNLNHFPSVFYHYDLGFEYFFDAQDGAGSAYFYDYSSAHFWYTSPTLFPNLYDFSLNTWIYYYPDLQTSDHYTSNPRYFYNYSATRIFTQ